MPRFLIDANLPYRFGLWQGTDFVHQRDIGDTWSDREVWEYAKARDLVIVTKDSDFSHWMMFSDPPPRVIRFRIGNMRLRELHSFVNGQWSQLATLTRNHKLLIVTRESIEAIN